MDEAEVEFWKNITLLSDTLINPMYVEIGTFCHTIVKNSHCHAQP